MLEGLLERTRRPVRRAELEADLACPPFPMPLVYLWSTFARLNGRRGGNGFGLNPIGWAEIDAYQRLTQSRLAPWEIQIVEELDDLYLQAQRKARS
jgi:hypothetical protein